MTIRIATLTDLSAILKLNHDLFLYERPLNQTYNLDWTYSDKGQKYFTDRLHHANTICLVAEIDHEIVGYLMGFIDTYSYRSQNPILEIENMIVVDEYRHQTVGSRLVSKLKELAKAKGVRRLRVEALLNNPRALNFYRTNGFIDAELILEQAI